MRPAAEAAAGITQPAFADCTAQRAQAGFVIKAAASAAGMLDLIAHPPPQPWTYGVEALFRDSQGNWSA